MKIALKRPRRSLNWLCAVLTVSTLAAALPAISPAAVCASGSAISDGLPEHLSVAGAYAIPALWNSQTGTWFDGYGHMKAGENPDTDHTVVYCLDRGLKGAPAHAPRTNWDALLRDNREIAAGLTAIAQAGYPYQTGGLHPRRAELCTQLAIWIYLAKKGFSPSGGSNQDLFDQIADPPPGTPHPGVHAPPVESGGRAWIDALVEAGLHTKAFKTGQIAAVPSGSWRRDERGRLLLDVRLLGDFDHWTPSRSPGQPAGISYSKMSGAPGETVTVIAADASVLKKTPSVTFEARVNQSPVNFGWFDSVTDAAGRHQAWLAVHKTFRFIAGSAALRLPAPTGRLVVRKNGDNRLPIEGVTFQLLSGNTPVKLKALAANRYAADPAGTYTTVKTDAGGVTAIDGLSAGTYTLKEISTPAPYLLPAAPATSITIKMGEQTEQLITNKRAMGQIIIRKTDAETGKSLAGAVFKVRLDQLTFPTLYKDWLASVGKDGQTGIQTAASGEVKTKQLPPGKYTVIETKTHAGYYLPADAGGIPVTVTADGKAAAEQTVAVENTPQHGRIVIEKRGDILKGWQTEIVDETFARTALTGDLELDLPETVQIPLSQPETGSESSKASETTDAAASTTAAAAVPAEASKAKESVKPEAAVAPEAPAASADRPPTTASGKEKAAPVSGSEAPAAEHPAQPVPQPVVQPLPPSPVGVMGIRLFGAATPADKAQSVTVEYDIIAPDGTVLKHIKGGRQTIPNLPAGTCTIVETNVPQAQKNYPDGLKADVKSGKEQVAKSYTVRTPIWQEGSLPGAVFQIIAAEDIYSASTERSGSQRKPVLLHKKGAVLDTLTSTASGPVKSKELPLGKYLLVESGVPHGYLKIDPIAVELKPDRPSVKVTSVSKRILNKKQRYQIKFVKAFETSKWFEHHKAAPAETRFGLYNAEPITWHGITLPKDSLMGLAKLNDQLEGQFDTDFDGKYYIRELHTHEAYNLAKDTAVEAKFIENGKPVETAPVVEPIQNTLKHGGLSLIKVDVETDATLAGAEYRLIAIKGDRRVDLGIYKTDPDGKLTVSDLEFGRYELVEVTAPAGYVRDDRPTAFVIDGEQDLSFRMTNRKNRIVITKTDAETGIALPEAEITIRDADGSAVFNRVTAADGTVSVTGLAPGVYTIHETKAPPGYMRNDAAGRFVISPDGQPDNAAHTIADQPTELIITKTDPGHRPLSGAAFQLKDEAGRLYRFRLQKGAYIADEAGDLDTLSGDASGRIVVRRLPPGTVTIAETRAPAGFRTGDPQTAEITDQTGGETPLALAIINAPVPPEETPPTPPSKPDIPARKEPPLPRTGAQEPFIWPALLIALALCSAAAAAGRHRKIK